MSVLSLGETVTIKGDLAEVIEVYTKGYRKIRFIETGYEIRAHVTNIGTGEVRDRLKRDVRGIGYFGVGQYNARNSSHAFWSNMFERCYNESFHTKQPTYKDCTVSEEWHNFQDFSKWFYGNYPIESEDKYELDKDLLYKGNKTYGPDYCCFIPKKVNQYLVNAKASRGLYPIGVSRVKKKAGLFEVRCADLAGVRRFLGHVTDPEQGFYLYKTYKEARIKELADMYFTSGKISEKIHTALLNYKIEIGD